MPLRKGPSGPRALGASILQIAEENATIPNLVPDVPTFVFASPGVPLEVAFTEWTPGDVLVIEHYSLCTVDAGPTNYKLTPKVDVGAGFKNISPTDGSSLVGPGSPSFSSSGTPSAVRLDKAPKIRLELLNGGSPGFPNPVFPILLRCYRTKGDAWIQGPAGVLV